MKHGGSSPHSQVPATCPYPEPALSCPHPTSHFLKIHRNIKLPYTPASSSGLFPSGFPIKTLYTTLLSPIRATCPAHPTFLHLIRTFLGQEYRSLSSSSCSFHYSPVTSSVFSPDPRLSIRTDYGAVSTSSNPNLEGHPLSVVRDGLFNIYVAPFLIGGRSSIRNLRTRHAVVTKYYRN